MTDAMSIGLLVLRVVIGLLFVGHGTQKLFGWFGGHGLEGTGGFMASLGYRPGKMHAFLAGFGEAGGGLLLALGLCTPLAAAVLIAVMVNAMGSAHWSNGLWVTNGGIEYPLVLCAAFVTVAYIGPGRFSLDRLISDSYDWHPWGVRWGTVAIVGGLVAGLLMLATRRPEAAVSAGSEPVQTPEHRAA
jgi:putative oxidoreductase